MAAAGRRRRPFATRWSPPRRPRRQPGTGRGAPPAPRTPSGRGARRGTRARSPHTRPRVSVASRHRRPRRRPGRSPSRRPRRTLHRPRPVAAVAPRPGLGGVRHRRRRIAIGLRQPQDELERLDRVLRRLDGHREPPGAEGRIARLGQPVRGTPVRGGDRRDVLERHGQGGAVPGPLHREEVRDDGAGDELVANLQPIVTIGAHEAVLQRLGQPGREVRLEAAGAAPRQGRRARREGARLDRLERRGRARQAVPVHRALGGGENPQHATAFGRAAGEPRRDEVGERSREGGAAELAPGRDQLLDDERRPRGPFGDQDHDRGGRPLAVDPLDEAGDLPARERREVDRGPAAAGPPRSP